MFVLTITIPTIALTTAVLASQFIGTACDLAFLRGATSKTDTCTTKAVGYGTDQLLSFFMFDLYNRANSQTLKQMYAVRLTYSIMFNITLLAFRWSCYVG